MKKHILILISFLACVISSFAQEPTQSAPPVQTPEERMKTFVDHISPKLNITKGQKDSLIRIYVGYMDDIQKYHAENNAKVITFMMKIRDDKVKSLLRDSVKYNKYLMILEDIKKQAEPRSGPMEEPRQQGGQHNKMGGSRNF
jgi:hypothetical protein